MHSEQYYSREPARSIRIVDRSNVAVQKALIEHVIPIHRCMCDAINPEARGLFVVV